MPRLVPQTVFSASATAAANSAAAANAKVPVSSGTCQKSSFGICDLVAITVSNDRPMHMCTDSQHYVVTFEYKSNQFENDNVQCTTTC